MCVSPTSGLFSDELYLHTQSEDDYQNLEDTLVVFCVDISGSMSVTTEVVHKFSIAALVQSSDLKYKTLSPVTPPHTHFSFAVEGHRCYTKALADINV